MRQNNTEVNRTFKVMTSKVCGEKSRCVAWFKLAELVSRKEKEKALNLYRLISYSFDDKAYVLQVEGDILWALEDNGALEKYSQAAYLYKKEKKLVSATAVYEHLLVLEPGNFDYLKTLILLYVFLSWPEKFEDKYIKLLEKLDQGVVGEVESWDFTKKLIDFLVDSKKLNSQQFEHEYEVELKKRSEYKWILKSLSSMLKKKNSSLYDLAKKYCLDNKLNFNS